MAIQTGGDGPASAAHALVSLLTWGSRNLVHNLAFIPDDQLTWKPAPGAKSALEIVLHTAESLRAMEPVLAGGDWTPCPQAADNREDAGRLLLAAAESFSAALLRMPREGQDRAVVVGRRQVRVRLSRAAEMPVADVVHHHGQIVYIQTLLGDEAYHFIPELNPPD